MQQSALQGLYFGLTEGTVTTMGIIIGMLASMPVKKAIISAVVAATLSDSFGDGIGLYYSEKARKGKETLKVITNMVTWKLLVSFLYLVPIFLLNNLKIAIICSSTLALLVIAKSFHYLAEEQEKGVDPKEFILKNTVMVAFVIFCTYQVVRIIGH